MKRSSGSAAAAPAGANRPFGAGQVERTVRADGRTWPSRRCRSARGRRRARRGSAADILPGRSASDRPSRGGRTAGRPRPGRAPGRRPGRKSNPAGPRVDADLLNEPAIAGLDRGSSSGSAETVTAPAAQAIDRGSASDVNRATGAPQSCLRRATRRSGIGQRPPSSTGTTLIRTMRIADRRSRASSTGRSATRRGLVAARVPLRHERHAPPIPEAPSPSSAALREIDIGISPVTDDPRPTGPRARLTARSQSRPGAAP